MNLQRSLVENLPLPSAKFSTYPVGGGLQRTGNATLLVKFVTPTNEVEATAVNLQLLVIEERLLVILLARSVPFSRFSYLLFG